MTIVERLRTARLVAVLRAADEAALHAQLDRARAAGITAIEVTTTGAGWSRVLAEAATDPTLLVGAGTVTATGHVADAHEAGAQFLVSPYAVAAEVTHAAGTTPFVQGGFTPGEIAAVATGGLAKLFPAATGGRAHLRVIRDILPGVELMPTGGITLDEVPAWIAAGALAVGMGGALFRDDPARVKDALEALRAGDAR